MKCRSAYLRASHTCLRRRTHVQAIEVLLLRPVCICQVAQVTRIVARVGACCLRGCAGCRVGTMRCLPYSSPSSPVLSNCSTKRQRREKCSSNFHNKVKHCDLCELSRARCSPGPPAANLCSCGFLY